MRSFEQLVKEFAEIEMNRGSHIDSPEDYDSITEFLSKTYLVTC